MTSIAITLTSSRSGSASVLAACTILMLATAAFSQQITGVPGSPDASVAISGEQIPAPPSKFGGTIERNAAQSKPYWPPRVEPHKDAPNVLLIPGTSSLAHLEENQAVGRIELDAEALEELEDLRA